MFPVFGHWFNDTDDLDAFGYNLAESYNHAEMYPCANETNGAHSCCSRLPRTTHSAVNAESTGTWELE